MLALPCMLYAMDLTVLNLAVPALSADLRPTATELLWIVDIYGFLVAGALITMGTLGDRIGRRRLLLIGAVAFGGASVVAAFLTTTSMLIATRALLGLAGATIAPSTLSLLRNMFHDPRQRTMAVGVWITEAPATPHKVLKALQERREPRRDGKRIIYDEELSIRAVSATAGKGADGGAFLLPDE